MNIILAGRTSAKFRAAGAASLAAVALLVAACGGSSSSSSSSVSAPATSKTRPPSLANVSAGGLSISTAKGPAGTYLTGASGRAVYLWVADANGKSSCSGACAGVWPPLIAKSRLTAAGGVNAQALGTTRRADGTTQVTYMGHPLYYFAADAARGTTNGQGSNSFGAKWWLVAASGAAITGGGASGSGSSVGGY